MPILMLDEVDEFDEGIYGDALGIPQSMNGIQSRVEEFSTAHRPGGLMERVIKGAELSGKRVYRWCIFEVLKQCPYPCSPKKPFKKCTEMVKYDALNIPHRFCDICDGRAKRGAGYYEISDLWQKFQNPIWSWERFACEMLCEMPKLEDAVFPMMTEKMHMLTVDWAVEQWAGTRWRLVMGADAGPVNSWVVWMLMGRWFEQHDDFWTAVVLHQLVTDRRTGVSDFADMVVREHTRLGYPKAVALFAGPSSVPQDTYLAMELDKTHRRGQLFMSSWQQPNGRHCIRVEKESMMLGHETIRNMLTLRPAPNGTPRPALLFGKSVRPTYDSLAFQIHGQDEDHGVAAVRYAVRGWEIMANRLLNQDNEGLAVAVSR